IEAPLPWKKSVFDSLPAYFQPIFDHARRTQKEGETLLTALSLSNFVLIKPHGSTTNPSVTRILIWERPDTPFAHFVRLEYLLPNWVIGDFAWAAAFERQNLYQFNEFLVKESRPSRDFLVCTHTAQDAAYDIYGNRLYDHLKRLSKRNTDIRIWEASHFGGHVFAPTMIELPTGVYWGNLYDSAPDMVIARRGNITGIKACLRGWSGAPSGFAQAADREMLMRLGWEWFDRPRKVEILNQQLDEKPEWAEIKITTAHATYKICVEIIYYLETFASSGEKEVVSYPQYRVTSVEIYHNTINFSLT
ncbi:MAG: sucrase ferredoxin, partial [Chloroflexota bacterium]